jgi:hypothetical protein
MQGAEPPQPRDELPPEKARVRDAQRRARIGLRRWLEQSRPQSIFSIPFIYGMAVPLVFLDFCLTVYQHVCFRLYAIATVARSEFFVIDRHHLAYLNVIEKAHCGYANGVLAYGREIAVRTEQYWCPIKHAHRAHGTHARAEHFLAYGDADEFPAGQERLRRELADERDQANPSSHRRRPS